MMLPVLLDLAENTLNAALRRDPVALERLGRLQDRVVEIRVTVPEIRLFLFPSSTGVQIMRQCEVESDCRIEGSAPALLRLLRGESQSDSLFGTEVTLSGDTHTGMALQSIFAQLDLDWEGLLGDRVGDLAAHEVMKLLRWGRRSSRESCDALLDDLDDYLHEEIRWVPAKPELESFYDRVDRIRLDVDRLRARIERLEGGD